MALTERGAYASAVLTEDGRLVFASGILVEDGERVFVEAAPLAAPLRTLLQLGVGR